MRRVGSLSYNLICFADSALYGPVALKLGVPHQELYTEMEALSIYAGRGICTCHEADAPLGALLLERIVPGTDLRSIKESEARFRIAAGVIGDLPVPLPGRHSLPAYADWVAGAFRRARAEAPRALAALIPAAERFLAQIDMPERPRVLLHGDLHHMNILQGAHGAWKAIDPKGAVGAACLEPARFMQNEFSMGAPEDRLDRLDQMTSIFADRLGEPKALLAQCAFVDQVLSACWSVEEQLDPKALRTAIERCEALLGYARTLTLA